MVFLKTLSFLFLFGLNLVVQCQPYNVLNPMNRLYPQRFQKRFNPVYSYDIFNQIFFRNLAHCEL